MSLSLSTNKPTFSGRTFVSGSATSALKAFDHTPEIKQELENSIKQVTDYVQKSTTQFPENVLLTITSRPATSLSEAYKIPLPYPASIIADIPAEGTVMAGGTIYREGKGFNLAHLANSAKNDTNWMQQYNRNKAGYDAIAQKWAKGQS
jgi:hypothetical protein